ncbi:hypothetical protein A2U01_0048084, partial [Trifolium medium]|nr:hypothetical protein [Trifolium medium]
FSEPGHVTSGNAEKCLFHDESDDAGMGVEAFLRLLHASWF